MAGHSYWRSGGGELAGGVGKRPITQIMPDLNELEKTTGPNFAEAMSKPLVVVENESRVQVAGIGYAGPATLQISDAQLLKWNRAVQTILAARTKKLHRSLN